ncbi:MAG: hypothetical protein LC746_13400 [Acidobacteria bacterium]|nr:hypothetical protein [Acidobacteriota bacterium]
MATSLGACVLVACAQGAAFAQRGRDDNKKDPPKPEKVIPKGEHQPKGNNDQQRGQPPPKNNDNKKPPF